MPPEYEIELHRAPNAGSVQQRVDDLDTTLFDHVESQTSADDRASLLALHAAMADIHGFFHVLEIGSHLGGTLQAFVVDPRCLGVTSIDPRPPRQPDDRGRWFEYEDNSTQRMLSLLDGVPGAELSKLTTIERGTDDIDPATITPLSLAFIDGEHTFDAALRDARFCRAAMRGDGVILFHDRSIIEPAVRAFVRETSGPVRAYPMRSDMFVVELGRRAQALRDPRVAARVTPPAARAWIRMNRVGLGRCMGGRRRRIGRRRFAGVRRRRRR